jgi:hypothetical protein
LRVELNSARRLPTASFNRAGNRSYALTMLAKPVLPPLSGSSIA